MYTGGSKIHISPVSRSHEKYISKISSFNVLLVRTQNSTHCYFCIPLMQLFKNFQHSPNFTRSLRKMYFLLPCLVTCEWKRICLFCLIFRVLSMSRIYSFGKLKEILDYIYCSLQLNLVKFFVGSKIYYMVLKRSK